MAKASNMQKYIAELLGTLTLTLAVSLAVLYELPLSVPVIAALTLGLFVYTVGPISGAHLNPAVTIGLWSIRKVSDGDAVKYVISQVIGALLAMLLLQFLVGAPLAVGAEDTMLVGIAEMIGAFMLAFGVSSVVYGKTGNNASGLVVGGSLLLGILIASSASNGVINPAVAIGVGSMSLMYIVGPIAGGILGANAYRWLCK